MDQNGSGVSEPASKRNYGIIMREYTVFNADQTEDVTLPETEEVLPSNPPQDATVLTAALAALPNPPSLSWGHNQAQYRPNDDIIEMPDPKRFYDDQGLMQTFWHELAHATGHHSRLNRWPDEWSGNVSIHERAAEELVAEITAAMLMTHYNRPVEANADSSAYVASWRKHLTQHPGHLITAAQQAQRAYDLIIGCLQPGDQVC